MTMNEFDCDVAHIIQNRDFSVLQKLMLYCSNSRAKIAVKVKDATVYETECTEKRILRINKISELQQEIEYLKSEIDATKLQQKIVDKKNFNVVKQQEKLQEEVEDAKLKRDNISLEMIDLQQEYEKRKENKISTWNAIKRACHTYKQYLDIYIHLVEDQNYEQIKVSFFITDADAQDKYFVHLSNSNSEWKVEKIHPVLKTEHLNNFKGIVDFENKSEILDLTAFLCKLRHIFIKYYLNIT